MVARDEYFYCPGCRKFHMNDGHTKTVNKKLCFFCNEIKSTTRMLTSTEGRTQICTECRQTFLKY